MSIRVKHCVVIICDGCGETAENDDIGTPHYESVWEAITNLGGDDESEWLMADREHVCPRCRAKRACATVGHDWADWMTSDARGIPIARRWCYRCSHHEMALPTEDGA